MKISTIKIHGYQVISTRTHGILDYVVGILLAASPWLLGFQNDRAETWIPVSLGLMTILYSLFTDYEAGIAKKIPMSWHLTLDMMSALFLGISPWAFGFHEEVWLPHVVIAAVEIMVVLMSQQTFEQDKTMRNQRLRK